MHYLKRLSDLKCIRVPRYLFSSVAEKVSHVQLHGYCYGSEQAYCAVIYAHAVTQDDSISASSLVSAKTKVAPINKRWIPQIELLSCELLAELMESVCKFLLGVIVVDKKYFWSDSQVVLAWIKGKDKTWKSWVQNRTTKILN